MSATNKKTRYVTSFVNTEWLDIKGDITLFITDEFDQIVSFFKLLEAVNSRSYIHYSFEYPNYIQKTGYTKRM